MPYSIKPNKGKFEVVNTETGQVKGTHDSRVKAQRQRRLLETIKHNPNWKPTGKLAKAAEGAVVVPTVPPVRPNSTALIEQAYNELREGADDAQL